MSNELIERVCRKMGIEPKREWAIGIAQRELVHRSFQSKEFADAWLTAEKKMGISLEYEVWECITYPDLLTDEWAGKLLAMLGAMRAKGIRAKVWMGAASWVVMIKQEVDVFEEIILSLESADTLPEAICRAIDAMPEGL